MADDSTLPDAHAPSPRAREPKAIHRALRVLEAVASIGPGARAKEISQVLDYPAATTYRLLNLLVQDGYLVRMQDLRGFALGQKVTTLAGYVEPARPPQAVRELLAELRSQVRAGVHLVRVEHHRGVIADADPLFPPSEALTSAPAMSATIPLLLDGLEPLVAAREDDGQESIAVSIRDEAFQVVAAVVLVVPARAQPPGARERELLEHYAEELRRLLV